VCFSSEAFDLVVVGEEFTVQCPLCGGPLHLEASDQFVCARGHTIDGAVLPRLSSARLSAALWMAIEALDAEAEALRILGGTEDGDGLASRATQDAQVLRAMAGAHLSEEFTGEHVI